MYIVSQVSIPLLSAAQLGSTKLSYAQLSQGANPNAMDEYGNTPLHYAVHIGSKEIANLLLQFHADPNIQNKKGKTPLHIAAQVDNDYLIRRLLLYGANPNIKDNEGNTPLHIAALNAHKLYSYKIAADLLDHNADLHLTNNRHQTPITLAEQASSHNTYNSHFKNRECVRIRHVLHILRHGQQSAHNQSMTILDRRYIRYAKANKIIALRDLMNGHHIHKNQQVGIYKRTALMYAVRNNCLDVINYLVNELDVDRCLKDTYGRNALDYARIYGNKKAELILLR